MTQQTMDRPRAATERFVVEEVEGGFRVYSPANRNRVYLVTGEDRDAACNCPEFKSRIDDAGFRCKHIAAVFPAANAESELSNQAQANCNGRSATPTNDAAADHSPAGSQMILKRSVSPDGRIDSLSIEFACAVSPGTDPEQVTKRAQSILSVQSGIASYFLGASRGNGNHNGKYERQRSSENGEPLAATMLEISGGRNGSLFITFDVDGETMRFFGEREELAQAIQQAGYIREARGIRKGKNLDLPCCVVTERTRDGKYTNVIEVLPPDDSSRSNGSSGGR